MAITKTTIENFTLENTNIGELIYVPIDPSHEAYPRLTINELNSGDTIQVNAANRVFFKPINGALVKQFTKWCHISSGGSDGSSHEEDQNKDSPREIYPETVNVNEISQYDGSAAPGHEYESQAIGCIFLGYQYDYVKTCGPNAAGYSSTQATNYYIHVEGETNYLTLNTIGDQGCDNCIYYSYRTSDSYETAYVFRSHVGKEHTYTNVIGFDGDYDVSDGTTEYVDQYTLEEESPQTTLPTVYQGLIRDGSVGTLVNLGWASVENKLRFESSTTNQGLQVEAGRGISNGVGGLRSILIYVDCYLCVLSPLYVGKNPPGSMESDDISSIVINNYSIVRKKNGDKIEDSIEDVDSNLQTSGAIQNCYRSIYDFKRYIRKISNPEYVETLDENHRFRDMVDDECRNIDYKHRWIRSLQLSHRRGESVPMHISGFHNIVMLVGKGGSTKLSSVSSGVKSKYARFTNYWYVCEGVSITTGTKKVVNHYGNLPTNKLVNRVAYPIFKPWAAVELVVFNDNDINAGGGFGWGKPESNDVYKYMNDIIKKNYGKYYTRLIYQATDIQVNIAMLDKTDPNYDEKRKAYIVQHLKNYLKTISPFRIEHYVCHGSRVEYDSATPNSGRCGLMITDNFGLGNQAFYNLHSQFPSNTKVNIFSQCCFGSGVNYQQSRSPATNLCPDYISPLDNVFAWFSACGTHCGYGYGEYDEDNHRIGREYTFATVSSVIDSLKKTNATNYKTIVDTYNVKMNKLKETAFKKIYEFYIENYELMKTLVDDERKQDWDDTRKCITQDILNNGDTYFCRESYKSKRTKSNGDIITDNNGNPVPPFGYIASDNHLDFNTYGKKYKIHDGFIGYILSRIYSDLIDETGIAWPITQYASIKSKQFLTKCRNFFTEHGYSLLYFLNDDIIERITSDEPQTPQWVNLGAQATEVNDYDWKSGFKFEGISDFNHEKLDELPNDMAEELANMFATREEKYSQFASLKEKVNILKEFITSQYVQETQDEHTVVSMVLSPRMCATGLFANTNAKFLKNPDTQEDEFLTNDNDLKELSKQT